MEIKFEEYVRNVRCTAQTALTLTSRLEKAAPANLSAAQRKALRRVRECAAKVAAVQAERDRLSPHKVKPLLGALGNAWSAFYGALHAKAQVHADVSALAAVAQVLVHSLFPEGVTFTQLPADRAWNEAQRRLDRVELEKLEKQIEDCVGSDYVQNARKATDTLGDAIGTGKDARPIPSSTALSESLNEMSRAVGTYGRLMAADVDEDDEESVRRFVDAMQPIDQHRAFVFGRGGGSEEEPEPQPEPGAPSEEEEPVVQPAPAPNGEART